LLRFIINNKYLNITGNILSITSIIFLILNFQPNSVPSYFINNYQNYIYILFLILFSSLSGFFLCLPLYKLINFKNKTKVTYRKIFFIFFDSHLGKYIPGNVFHYVKRQINAKIYGNIPQRIMISCGLIETLLNILGSLVLILFLFAFYFKFFGLLSAIIILLAYYFIKHKLNKDNIAVFEKCVFSFSIYYLIQSLIFILIFLLIINYENTFNIMNYEELLLITISYTMASLFGFLTPGSPGGIGVREYGTIAILEILNHQLLNQQQNIQEIILAVIVMRFVNIISDVMLYISTKKV